MVPRAPCCVVCPARYGARAGPPIASRSEPRSSRPATRSSGNYPPGPKVEEAGVAEIAAHITGTVWKVECRVGQEVEVGDTLVVLEAMKMEMPVEAEDPGTVAEIRCTEGQAVAQGETLVVLE